MKVKFIGLKSNSGVSRKSGREYSFQSALFTSEFSENSVNNGAHGLDVHRCSVPEEYKDLFVPENLGKDFDVKFYYAGGYENIAFATVLSK